jgi:hypothetical protein
MSSSSLVVLDRSVTSDYGSNRAEKFGSPSYGLSIFLTLSRIRFRQRSRHRSLFDCAQHAYKAAARGLARWHAWMRLNSRSGTERAHGAGVLPAPLLHLPQAV